MECSCSAYGGDFDDDGVYSSSRELTARKEHQCYECQRTIKKGEKFTTDNIRVIRPGYGLAPKYLVKILNKRAKNFISTGTPLKLNLLD